MKRVNPTQTQANRHRNLIFRRTTGGRRTIMSKCALRILPVVRIIVFIFGAVRINVHYSTEAFSSEQKSMAFDNIDFVL